MELTLHYEGALKSNGSPEDKQAIRRHFHTQLRTFWKQEPLHLERLADLLKRNPKPGNVGIIVERAGFFWAPLISSRLLVFAELDITWLRDGPPGALVQSGDIDNRLKTLFDALQVSPYENAVPAGDAPQSDEDPFFVLLEDDKLISKVTVSTDQLLNPGGNKNEVVLFLRVKSKVQAITWGNVAFA